MQRITTYSELREGLAREAEDGYREFIMRGIPSDRPFIGVRIPRIRQLTRRIPHERYPEFIQVEPVAFEEVLARGFLISQLEYDQMLTYFNSQIDYIDDWCACDTFCSALSKLVKKHQADFLETKLEDLLESKKEFATRVGLVSLKCHYIEPDYLAVIFDRAEQLANREEYYVKMAIAWLLAECFIKFPDETLAYLKVAHLPVWTHNKTISKICDSFRVDPEVKTYLKTLRRKNTT